MSELDELRGLIAEQDAWPQDEQLPLHGKGVSTFGKTPEEMDAVRITVEGVARNTATGAVVVDVAGKAIQTDMQPWADDVVGEHVTVTGIVKSGEQDKGLQEAYQDGP